MKQLAQKHYTETEVKKALHYQDASRFITFRYELLGVRDNIIQRDIGDVSNCDVEYASLAQIKSTAKLEITEHAKNNIDFSNTKIKPYFQLRMPDGGFCEWAEGVFLLQTPSKKKTGVFKKYDIEAYDKLSILERDKFEKSYVVKKGSNVINAVINIITSARIETSNIPASDLTLTTNKEFAPNVSKLTAINELLDIANYESLQADENGVLVSQRYISPENRPVDYYYLKNQCLIFNDAELELDYYNACNVFSATVVNTELNTSLYASYENNNMSSPISIPRLNRRITKDQYQLSEGITQAELEIYVRKKAFEESQIYSHININTVLMPHHSYLNVLSFDHELLQGPTVFTETRWSKKLKAGSKMNHYCRRLVQI